MRGLAFMMGVSTLALGIAAQATGAEALERAPVVRTYVEIGRAVYDDSLITAKVLHTAIKAFLDKPGQDTQDVAKAAWQSARMPYSQSEVFRFGNLTVDDWEGRVNSWPLDEGLIDYVATNYGTSSDENPLYTANIIAGTSIRIGKKTVDVTEITPVLLRDTLQGAGGVESNVAVGYHAIEFLLWGQDLNGTGPGAGARSWTDYSLDRCTNGNCDRRRAYLAAAVDLLVADLEEMATSWAEGGEARNAVLKSTPDEALKAMLTGIGSLSYGELGGERTKLGLMLHDPEEEQDCFSDLTHNEHYADQLGMMNVYNGRYERVDGTVVTGPSISALAASVAPEADAQVHKDMDATFAALTVMKQTADSGTMAYDQMIGADNPIGNKMVQDVVDGLVTQTKSVEAVVAALGLEITVEGSDSLDNPEAVTGQ